MVIPTVPKVSSKPKFIKASTCLILFVSGCVIINALLICIWLLHGSHSPVPTGTSSAAVSRMDLPPAKDNILLEKATIEAVIPVTTPPPIIIAHVVSLIKCKKSSSVTGFLDAAAVLRHSIHKQSIHAQASKYDYQMYAIVHKDGCSENAATLSQLGYKTLVRDTPVKLEEMEGEWYRNHVENENCCGSKVRKNTFDR